MVFNVTNEFKKKKKRGARNLIIYAYDPNQEILALEKEN